MERYLMAMAEADAEASNFHNFRLWEILLPDTHKANVNSLGATRRPQEQP